MSAVPGRWLVVSVAVPPDDDGLVTEGLLLLGGRAVEEREGRAVTHLPEPPAGQVSVEALEARLRALTGLAGLDVRLTWQEQEDWAETWKRGLAPRRITDRLVVTPSWCEPERRDGDLVVTVDPGMAFGTAEHGTTRGCLRLMDGTVASGERLLDVGAGSAILAVAAALLGASEVTAMEGDALAVPAALENVERNGVADRVSVEETWATAEDLPLRGPVDGLMANIESGVLRPLLGAFADTVRPGGWLVLGGILAGEWEGFAAEAAAAGWTQEAVDADGEWRSGRFRRAG
ncbi:MAG: 50S ribosomal protein L11 methyltransferase [Gemmatimonadetes bacterium]|nr:50S ribosomal protein L11 methyltransferase [Gemmatimonadota bacterium]